MLSRLRGALMRKTAVILALVALGFLGGSANAQDRSYGGFECTDDCSGHEAGYKWATRHDVEDEENCPDGNSQSFHEGCVARTRDSFRDPDADDGGNMAGEPVRDPDDDDQ